MKKPGSVWDFTVKQQGESVPLSDYAGKVVLIVNTATACGFTPQYAGLEKLYQDYQGQGFVILDFPCNQFAGQAPGSDEEIDNFCQLNYATSFPRFSKVDVRGKEADPLFVYLQAETPGILGKAIKWNFTKFLINRQGKVVRRFGPQVKPEQLAGAIEELLGTLE